MSKIIMSTLEKVCLPEKGAIISGPFGSNISSKYFVEKGVPVIRGNNLSLNFDKFYDNGFVYVTKEKADELKCYAYRDDLIFTAAGTIGQVGIIPRSSKYTEYVISNKQIRVRIDTTKLDVLYAYYWFSSSWIQNLLIKNNKGSTVPLLTLSEVKDLPIFYPESMDTQRKIVSCIDIISKKIENNNYISKQLEQMAKMLYDYWFLQFDFPDKNGNPYRQSGGKMVYNKELNREIPEGWKTNFLDEMFSVTMGTSPVGESLNEKGEGIEFYQGSTDFGDFYPAPRVYTTNPIRFAKANDVLMSVRAPVGALNMARRDCCIGRGLAAIHYISPLYAWNTIKLFQPYFDVYNGNGTTFGALTADDLKKQVVIKPAEKVIQEYVNWAKPVEQKLSSIAKENQGLTSLRDFLLPMLMNGQAKVV